MKTLFLLLLCVLVSSWQNLHADVNVTNLSATVTMPTNSFVLVLTGSPPKLVRIPTTSFFASPANTNNGNYQHGSYALTNLLAMGITNIIAGTNIVMYTNAGNLVITASITPGNLTNAYFHTNNVSVGTLKAGFTNGSFAVVTISNALQAMWMSNNAVLWKKLAP